MASVRDIFIRLGIKSDPRKLQQINNGLNAVKASAIGLGRVLATGILAVGFKKMIGVASDIQETANKFGAVFGEAGSDVQQQLDDIRKRTGATNLELQDMAGNIGALVKPSLGSAAAAGVLGANVAELALDISSFNNVSAEDALTALRSGLIGSAEPLQRFGVDVRAAALTLEAMRQGIGKSVKEMTEGERIQLRYAAIQRQLGAQGATGDATRTALDFANASRNLGAAMKETAGIIGTLFLGSVGGLVNKTRELVDRFQAWLAVNREFLQQGLNRFLDRTGRIISNVFGLIRDVVNATTDWADSLGPLGKQIFNVVKTVALLAAILLLPGGAILLLMGLLGLLIDDFQVWREGGESVIGDLIGSFENLTTQVEVYREAAVATFRDMTTFGAEAQLAMAAVASAITAVAVAIVVKLVAANASAIASYIALKAFTLQYYAVVAAGAIKTAAIAAAAQAKIAAGWLISLGPIAIIAGLIGGIVFMLHDLKKETGSWGKAWEELSVTVFDFWSDMFAKLGKFLLGELVRAAMSVAKKLGAIGKAVSGFFGGGDESTPAAATARPGAGAGASVSSTNAPTFNMEINAGPNINTEQLAEMIPPLIVKEQEKLHRTEARNFELAAAGAT